MLASLKATRRHRVIIALALSVSAPGLALGQTTSPANSPTAPRSLEQIESELTKEPRNPQLRFLKGVALAQAQRAPEAQAIFEALINDFPELPEPYNNLAVIRATQNDLEGARQVLVQAIRALPTYALAHENLGEVYLRLAEQSWAQAARIGTSRASAEKKLELTRELLSRVTEIAPTEPPARGQTQGAPHPALPASSSTPRSGASSQQPPQ